MPHKDRYETVIGLEVHAQLKTVSKLFCADSTVFGKEPNTQVSAISLGHPGTLPKLNREAIHLAVRLGLATNCTIVQHNYFARKNYFYPDLPKGYQVSQHTTPICRKGFMEVVSGNELRKIRINRIHIEEDAGKSLHDEEGDESNLDFNRAGMPLLEIVTEPDLETAEEAMYFVSQLRKLVRHLDVCDGNMEEGSLRCDVNISVRLKGDTKLGTKVEIKNLNSIRFISKAIEHESARLIDLHSRGAIILQQTRGFDERTGSTYTIRTKEDEDDYRYFPEPDLPPFHISEETILSIRKNMPPLQEDTKMMLMEKYQLSDYDSGQLSLDTELCRLFTTIALHNNNFKAVANWVIGPIKKFVSSKDSFTENDIPPSGIAAIIRLIDEGSINYNIGVQKVFPELLNNPLLNVEELVKEKGWILQTSHDDLDQWIGQALEKYAAKIPEYKKGKKGLLSVFVGEVMKLSKGTADARLVTNRITEKLKH